MSDKGIRPAANAKFMELLPQRKELGNTKFRKTVMGYLMEQFSCSNPAAATHYNHAFKQVKKDHPELVEGLGRPEGKNNGGRKKKAAVEVPAADAAAAGGEEVQTGEVQAAVTEEPAVQLYSVKKRSDDSVVADGLTKEAADALIAKAKAAKKAALYY